MKIKDKFRNLDQKLVLELSKRRLPSFQQLKYLNRVLDKKEILIIRICWAVILAALIYSGANFYSSHLKVIPKNGGQYVEGIVGHPVYINPILGTQNQADIDLSKLIFSGLLKKDEEGNLANDLAQSVEKSDDSKTYKVKLKEGLKWHDGENLTADDVIFTFQSIKDSQWQSPLQISFRGIGVEKIDDLTVILRLKTPFSLFESLLTTGIIPSHLWTQIDPTGLRLSELNLKPVGSGPYKFLSFNKDKNGKIKSYALKRFEDYGGSGPFLETMEIKFYQDEESALQALAEGNIDGLALTNPKPVKTKSQSSEYSFNLPRYTAFFFNLDSSKTLKNKLIRQALAQSFNKEKALGEIFQDQKIKIINSPILEGMSGFDTAIREYEYSPSSTKDIFNKLQWTLTDGIRKRGEDKLSLTITAIDKNSNLEIARAAAKEWKDEGIEVKIDAVDAENIIRNAVKNRDFEILLFSEIFGIEPDPLPFWHSSQAKDPGLNISVYRNEKADSLLEKARAETDPDKRAETYRQFQKILLDDAPAIFLYQSIGTYYLPSDIKGVKLKGLRNLSSRLDNINNWYIKTKKKFEPFSKLDENEP